MKQFLKQVNSFTTAQRGKCTLRNWLAGESPWAGVVLLSIIFKFIVWTFCFRLFSSACTHMRVYACVSVCVFVCTRANIEVKEQLSTAVQLSALSVQHVDT